MLILPCPPPPGVIQITRLIFRRLAPTLFIPPLNRISTAKRYTPNSKHLSTVRQVVKMYSPLQAAPNREDIISLLPRQPSPDLLLNPQSGYPSEK